MTRVQETWKLHCKKSRLNAGQINCKRQRKTKKMIVIKNDLEANDFFLIFEANDLVIDMIFNRLL
jgi:hypothetical protein